MITRPQRERTRWDWKPLIVIPMMVYLNVAPQETVFSHGASSATASLATPVGATPFNAAPQEPSRYYDMSAISEGGSKNRAEPAVAAPVQGVNSRGEAYVLERNPKYPLLRFEMRLLQPNTIVDRRSGI